VKLTPLTLSAILVLYDLLKLLVRWVLETWIDSRDGAA
jgi:hypothetical protein